MTKWHQYEKNVSRALPAVFQSYFALPAAQAVKSHHFHSLNGIYSQCNTAKSFICKTPERQRPGWAKSLLTEKSNHKWW